MSKISRRAVLKSAAVAAATTSGLLRQTSVLGQTGQPTTRGGRASVDVFLTEPIKDVAGKPAIIDPLLHGHFTEHIGGVIYDGIWVGPESPVPNVNGIRRSLVDSLKKLAPPVIRWPGGCFADSYQWRDGIGPREKRPRRFGRWSEVTEPNHFGTHEFMRFCRLVGAEPYFAANVGMGTPEEFQQWVEYCNAPVGSTTLGDERAANGDRDPFRIRLWGVGNENWGCGGNFTPEDYCTEYRKFTTWLPGYGVPLVPIACGPNGNDVNWTKRFFKKWADYTRAPISGYSAHYYCGTAGTDTEFNVDQWYELLDRANQMEPLVRDQWAAIGEFDPQHAIKLIIDEWGCWHPEDKRLNPRHLYAQISTMRDALVAALTLDTFQRHPEKVMMANVAQLINNLHSLYMADGDKFVETTNYHVFTMYQPHKGAMAIPLKVEAPQVGYRRGNETPRVFRVAGSASLRDKTATVTLVHTHASEPIEVAINLRGGSAQAVDGVVLAGAKLNSANTFEKPAEVVPKKLDVPAPKGGEVIMTLPPASVTRLQVTLG